MIECCADFPTVSWFSTGLPEGSFPLLLEVSFEHSRSEAHGLGEMGQHSLVYMSRPFICKLLLITWKPENVSRLGSPPL